MIEDYQIRIRTGAVEKTGERERTRRGTWRDKTRFVERYVTPAGTFLPEEWKNGRGPPLRRRENLLFWKESKITAESTASGCAQRATWKNTQWNACVTGHIGTGKTLRT